MTLYIVRHGETERLIKATAASVAVRHAAKSIITARVAKPLEIATLMQRGVPLEDAGTDPDPIPPVPLPEREPCVMSADEIAEAMPGAQVAATKAAKA